MPYRSDDSIEGPLHALAAEAQARLDSPDVQGALRQPVYCVEIALPGGRRAAAFRAAICRVSPFCDSNPVLHSWTFLLGPDEQLPEAHWAMPLCMVAGALPERIWLDANEQGRTEALTFIEQAFRARADLEISRRARRVRRPLVAPTDADLTNIENEATAASAA